MKHFTGEVVSLSKSLLLALILSLGVSFAYAQFGPDPGTVAPNNNVPAPVNVGTEAQVKAGPLGVTAFTADSAAISGNLTVSGNQYGSGGLLLRDAGGSWMRTYGATGWYNGTYGGGWYMADSTWVSVYGNKNIYTGGVIRGDGGFTGPSFTDINNGGYYVDPNGTSRLGAVNADSLYSYNWVQSASYMQANSYIYSQMFIDLNNGGYYVDPNGTSRMGTIVADSVSSSALFLPVEGSVTTYCAPSERGKMKMVYEGGADRLYICVLYLGQYRWSMH